MLHKRLIIILFLSFLAMSLAAQALIKPVFPDGSTGLVYIEGEDAVSTNFANQAVSNYGCSGYRAVQLSRNTGLQGGAAFYAEFVFYIEEAGDYEFWYGGTPPGPADELSPSYSSPFSFSIDGAELVDVYREDIHVVEGYTPSYYWNKCSTVNLSEGSHRLRFEVSKKRGYDGRFYFYLDSLFFLNKDKIEEVVNVKPDVFPTDLESSAIDNPFMSINDYQSYINAHPDEPSAYIELSLVFSLIGDYQGALKTLTKAMALDAANPYPIVLAAKNRLWKGDVRESLALYDRALSVDPENPVLWAEAGKVAAWTAEYDKSIDFFTRGLVKFPDDMNMRVNLGLTYLWMARDNDAQDAFREALKIASDSPEKLSELGWIEDVAGYPEYARDVYEQSIKLFPEYLEFYLLLQASFLSGGDREGADNVGRLIESTFISSDQMQNKLEIYQKKLNLRDDVINVYLSKLHNDPGNLELRQELAQTFFWNGMSSDAIEQIKYVITTHAYRAAETFVRRNVGLFQLMDQTVSIVPFFNGFDSASSTVRKKLTAAAAELKKAESTAASTEGSDKAAAAKEGLRISQQAFADTLAEAQYLVGLMDDRKAAVEFYEEMVNGVLEKEKLEDEAFISVIGSSGWSWAKSWQTDELTEIFNNEKELASFMLSRVLMSDGRYEKAVEVLLPEPETGVVVIETAEDADDVKAAAGSASLPELDFSSLPSGILYSLYQALLYSGDTGIDDGGYRSRLTAAESDRLLSDYPHIESVEAELNLAAGMISTNAATADAGSGLYLPPPGVYFEGLKEESAEYLKVLTAYEKAASADRKKITGLRNRLSAVIGKELERANYYLEADTYLIRYELGNYFLDEGKNAEAAVQFRRVIAVDPWNISATYKLGIVEQRYGNWSEAMKYYKKVYQQDQTYENSVYYYNQLARLHADKFSSSVQLINSPTEIALTGKLDYSTEFNSLLGLGIKYTLDQQRLYWEYDEPQQGSFQVHLLEAALPLTFNILGLKIVPHAGIYTENYFYTTDYNFSTPSQYSDDESVSLVEFLSKFQAYPKYGVSTRWSWSFLTVDAAWENSIEADTFYEGRERIRKNDVELNANTWFDLEDQDFLGPLTTRTYGRLQFMDDGIFKGQIYQDVMLGFNLLNNPVIRLSPSVSVNYEDSTDLPGTGYWAPQGVLEAKGLLRSAFTFPSSDWSSAFEAVIWAGCGGYWSDLGSADISVSSSVKAEGGLGATWVKNSSVYHLNLSGLGTFTTEGNEYWEFSIALGTDITLPGLLTK